MSAKRRVFSRCSAPSILLSAALISACGDGDSPTDGGPDAGPQDMGSPNDSGQPGDGGQPVDGGRPADGGGASNAYTFKSRFTPGQSSVTYSGQVHRQVLMSDLKAHIAGLTERLDLGTLTPTTGGVLAELNFYYRFDGATSSDVDILLDTEPATRQSTYGDISSGANLTGKIAGNDAVGQHEDWSTAFAGWDDPNVTTPESLVLAWFQELETLAVRRANGDIPRDPGGAPIAEVFVTDRGHDLAELLQKFLGMAIAYSQGTDDYLDDDLDGKGLNSDHSAPVEGKPYTELEHTWDEGFGYFGAARDYADYTDDELAAKGGRPDYAKGYHDTNGDSAIDLGSEFNFGHAVNAAKRDRGSADSAKTDFTRDAVEGFLEGRALLASAGGPLDAEQIARLKSARDRAVGAWEAAIAATIVHYINAVLAHTAAIGTEAYNFRDHAKEWSELKGFALGLQFNPRSRVGDADFAELHRLLRSAPALGAAEAAAYRADLLAARDIVQAAYGFDDANVGDDNGEGGW